MGDRKRRVWSLNRTIVSIIIIGYAAFLGVLFIANGYLIANYQKEVQNQNRQILEEEIQTAENNLKEMKDDIYNVYSNHGNFKTLLTAKEELQQFSDVYEIYNELRNKAVLNLNMDGFLIFYNQLKDCRYYLPSVNSANAGSLYTTEQVDTLYAKMKSVVQTSTGNRVWWTVIGHGEGASLAVICKKNNAAVCGVYNLDRIEHRLNERLDKPIKVCLLDEINLYSEANTANQFNLSQSIVTEEKQFQKEIGHSKILGQEVGNTRLWVCMIQEREWRDYFAEPQILLLLLTLLSLFIVAGVLKFIRNQYVKPVVELTEVMGRIREGNWEVSAQADSNCKEINDITKMFDSMLQEIKMHKIQIYEETIEKQKAEMQYLQLQLKPHFFLNCLKTLHVMAMESKSMQAQNFIMNISHYLRYLLQSERELVPVQAEVEFVRNYIEMQQNMTGRAVEAEYFIEEESKECSIPVLCMQTFVENSVKHAKLAAVGSKLLLRIEVHFLRTEEGNYLDLIVRDNGEGYPDAVLKEILKEAASGNGNIGINNLKRRCHLLYKGEEAYIFENQNGAYNELILPEREQNHEGPNCR